MKASRLTLIFSFLAAALVVLLAGIWSGQQPQVIVPQTSSDQAATSHQPERQAPVTTSAAATPPIKRPALSTHTEHQAHYQTADRSATDEKNKDKASPELPAEVHAYIESKRIPASELKPVTHADGSVSLDLKGQYQHVPVAIIGEDGKVTIVETEIKPIADQ